MRLRICPFYHAVGRPDKIALESQQRNIWNKKQKFGHVAFYIFETLIRLAFLLLMV